MSKKLYCKEYVDKIRGILGLLEYSSNIVIPSSSDPAEILSYVIIQSISLGDESMFWSLAPPSNIIGFCCSPKLITNDPTDIIYARIKHTNSNRHNYKINAKYIPQLGLKFKVNSIKLNIYNFKNIIKNGYIDEIDNASWAAIYQLWSLTNNGVWTYKPKQK